MSPTLNSPFDERHHSGWVRPARQCRRVHGEPHTRGDGTPTRWISLAHAALNQAKMAAPRTASSFSSSSVGNASDSAQGRCAQGRDPTMTRTP